ncbi:hypothetical protein [Algoriphagus sp. A40]|uniref:hypothetical protein n=1 Tax=Algoriphagus sp. A40 TaxID=1945863 RepID=UPI000986A21D|nr:hypothetical protein [Algoriphagus sp. A40]OOG77678.1 hypothetical protein B0E43_04590 [Algoriphagus sp. A40]
MNSQHLTEEEIQDCAIAKEAIAPVVKAHLSHCTSCEEKVRTFSLLFSSMKEIPPSEFGFDVSSLVLAQLENNSSRHRWSNFAIGLFIALGIVCSGMLLLNVKQLISGFGGYLLLLTALLVLLIQIGSTYQKYLTQIDLLKK